jgi:hypothetical protein
MGWEKGKKGRREEGEGREQKGTKFFPCGKKVNGC